MQQYTLVQTSISHKTRINTMKSLKILLLSSAHAFIIYACDDPENEPISPILKLLHSKEEIEGEFMLSVSYSLQPRRAGIGSAIIHLEGNGDIEDYGTYSLNLEHRVLNVGLRESALLDNGRFKMSSAEGSMIYGIYGGPKSDLDGHLEIKGRINGGSGCFSGAYGGISVELIPQNESEYLAIVYGTIKLRERNRQGTFKYKKFEDMRSQLSEIA